jgi:hypothetical protein
MLVESFIAFIFGLCISGFLTQSFGKPPLVLSLIELFGVIMVLTIATYLDITHKMTKISLGLLENFFFVPIFFVKIFVMFVIIVVTSIFVRLIFFSLGLTKGYLNLIKIISADGLEEILVECPNCALQIPIGFDNCFNCGTNFLDNELRTKIYEMSKKGLIYTEQI